MFQDQESFDLRNVEDHQTRNHETRQTLGQSLSNHSPSFKMADYISPHHHITMSYMSTSHVLSENQADEQRHIIHQHHNQLRKPNPERVLDPLSVETDTWVMLSTKLVFQTYNAVIPWPGISRVHEDLFRLFLPLISLEPARSDLPTFFA